MLGRPLDASFFVLNPPLRMTSAGTSASGVATRPANGRCPGAADAVSLSLYRDLQREL